MASTICGPFTRPSLCTTSFKYRLVAVQGSRFAVKILAFPKTRRTPAIALRNGQWMRLRARGRVTITIEKRLPVQGGLGAGSGNAVATLIGLERALKKKLPGAEKLRIAAEVGLGFAAVSRGWDGAGCGARRGSLSVARFAGHGLRGGHAGDWGFDSTGVCGLGWDDGGRADLKREATCRRFARPAELRRPGRVGPSPHGSPRQPPN